MHLLRRIWELPPREVARRIRRRLFPVAGRIPLAYRCRELVAVGGRPVLEFDPLAEWIAELHRRSRPRARCLHLIDFGNHRRTRNPFSGMYSARRDDHDRRHGRGIDLARAPKGLAIFREAGFDAGLTPYYTFPEYYDETVAPEWRDRFGDDDLFLKTALLYGPQPAPE